MASTPIRWERLFLFQAQHSGVYQHCGEGHPHGDVAEFDFRYNSGTALKVTNAERADMLLATIEGKRLTYRRTGDTDSA